MEHVELSMARYLGDEVMDAFSDEDITEIYVNPQDNLLWLETHSSKTRTDVQLDPGRIQQFLGAVAAWKKKNLDPSEPSIAAALPQERFNGARLQGFIADYSADGACFVIRKHALKIYPLSSYVEDGIMTAHQKDKIVQAVRERKNIIVAGGARSGKTTLCNAIIREIAEQTPEHRLLILEDQPELQPASKDYLRLTTTKAKSLADAVKDTLRTRPDRILVGEVRDWEAADMLDAWRTDHPGGICTVHANSPASALHRIGQFAEQKTGTNQEELVREAVDIVVHIGYPPSGRKVKSMTSVSSPDTESTYAPYLTPL